MVNLNVAVLHSKRHRAPSVLNLKQGLDATEFNVDIYPLRALSESPERSMKYVVAASIMARGLKTYFSNWNKYDVVIIHKLLTPLDLPILESLYTKQSSVIFSTYDGTYTKRPRTTTYLAKAVDGIVATSETIFEYYSPYSTKLSYIPPSVDTKLFSPQQTTKSGEETTHSNNTTTIGWIGDANQHKDELKFLLDIFSSSPSVIDELEIRILPGGDLPADFRSKFERLDAPVDIIGWVERDKVPDVINSFDIGLAPLKRSAFNAARSSEKVREYMACGVPVLGSNFGENKYLIPNNGGFLVESKREWIHALNQIQNGDYDLEKMGKIARDYAKNNYSAEEVGHRWERFVYEVATDD